MADVASPAESSANSDEGGAAEEPLDPASRTAHVGRATRLTLWTTCSVALFSRFHRLEYLDPTAAPRMMVGGDWTTYLVSPNFLRSADPLTWPIGRIPDYVAPEGTMLGQTDTVPILTPLYRLLIAFSPDSPIQLVGPLILTAYVVTFLMTARFVHRLTTHRPGWQRELMAIAFATLVTVAPFWNLQYVHPALMQQWLLVWAAIIALRRCIDGDGEPLSDRALLLAGLGPVILAAAVQPYLVPMVALITIGPDLAAVRSRPKVVLTKWLAAVAAVGAVSVALGFISPGSRLGSTGFGNYASDLLAVFDPDAQSRIVPDIPTRPDSIGGYAYPGLGGLMFLVVAAAVAAWSRRARALAAKSPPPTEGGATVVRFRTGAAAGLMLTTAAATAFAVAPVLRIGGRTLVDLSAVANRASSLTAVFRVNGRFIWVLVWLALLCGAVVLCRSRAFTVALILTTASAAVQIGDVIPWTPLLRPNESVEYADAAARLGDLRASGIESIQFQPPVVIPGCDSGQFGDFTYLGDVILAASVQQLAVNSGYTSRALPAYEQAICIDQAAAFTDRQYDTTVLYVVPADAANPPGLRCRTLTSLLKGCRV
jgi:hypothetical protein